MRSNVDLLLLLCGQWWFLVCFIHFILLFIFFLVFFCSFRRYWWMRPLISQIRHPLRTILPGILLPIIKALAVIYAFICIMNFDLSKWVVWSLWVTQLNCVSKIPWTNRCFINLSMDLLHLVFSRCGFLTALSTVPAALRKISHILWLMHRLLLRAGLTRMFF